MVFTPPLYYSAVSPIRRTIANEFHERKKFLILWMALQRPSVKYFLDYYWRLALSLALSSRVGSTLSWHILTLSHTNWGQPA